MKEAGRKARNTQRLMKGNSAFAARFTRVITRLEGVGIRPRIQDACQSRQYQLTAFLSGSARAMTGWDTCHLEPTGITIAQAKVGGRPT